MAEPTFLRVLGRRDVLALSFGAMIGWSWVLLTAAWLTRAGTLGTLAAFAIGGVAVLLIALTYAELVAAMPKAGGEHVYAERAFGRGGAFVCAWALVMGYVTVPVFEAVALPTALEYLFPELRAGLLWQVAGSDVHASFVAIGILGAVVMTGVNLVGMKVAAVVQTWVTAAFFAIGVVFVATSLTTGSFENTAPLVTDTAGMLGVLIMVPALMVGFDVIPQSAEEIDLPFRQVGRLLVVSVAIAILWYALVSLGVALSLDASTRAGSTMGTADAMSAAFGGGILGAWAGRLMVLAGIGGLLTRWLAFIIGGSRVLYALGHAGLLPPAFARLHPRFRTPHVAILVIGALSCIAPFFGRTILVWLIDAGSFAIVIAYGMVAGAFLVLRRREPDLARPFRVRHGNLVGGAAVALSIGLFCVYLPFSPSALVWPEEWMLVIAWAVAGVVLYAAASRRRSGLDHADRPAGSI